MPPLAIVHSENIVISLGPLNLIVGANGSGKSNVYRAMRLLADTAQGSVIPSLAYEGGLSSTLWAGPEIIGQSVKRGDYPVEGTRRREPISLRLGFAGEEYGYAIDLGLPAPGSSAFSRDPEIKRECIWHGPRLRPSTLLVDRHTNVVRLRYGDGDWQVASKELPRSIA